jgi:RNA polymerase sigma factor (sigma-70 family)
MVAELEPGLPGSWLQDCFLPERQYSPCDGMGDAAMTAMRGAFIDFYDQQHQALVRFLMNAGASLPVAEDAMQEAFTDAWLLVQSGTWDGVRNPAGWIRVVGLRKYYHQRGRAGREVPVPNIADAPVRGPYPADLAWEAQCVLTTLHDLPADQRVALAFQIDGFSCRETAEHLGITEQEVRDLRKKARRWLTRQTDKTPAGGRLL